MRKETERDVKIMAPLGCETSEGCSEVLYLLDFIHRDEAAPSRLSLQGIYSGVDIGTMYA
jgi:hypothetical protein